MKQDMRLHSFKLRAMFAVLRIVDRLGLGPDPAKITSQSMAERKANKAAPWMTVPLPTDVAMSYGGFQGRSGTIAVKIYRPATINPKSPRVMFLHGGGWITGGVDTLDHTSANVAREAQALLVSVDYRLAPETPFPGGLEDCLDALRWIATDTSLGPVPASGVAVIGESAGGNLAAALCVLNARQPVAKLCHQTLIYPLVDATLASPSVDNGQPGLDRKNVEKLLDMYRGTAPLTDPLISPIFADNLAAVPPALIITAEADPARDDGARYAEKLKSVGVNARYLNYMGMPHAFFLMPAVCTAAAEGITQIAKEISAFAHD